MADLDEFPALLIVRECSTRVNSVLLDRKILDLETVMMMTLYGSYDEEWSAEWMSEINEQRTKGLNALPFNVLETWRREMQSQWAQKVRWEGIDPSKFAALHSFFYGSGAMNYWATNPVWYVRQMMFAGRFGIIDGDLDSGKTDCSLLMCEKLIEAFLEFVERGSHSNLARIVKEQDSGMTSVEADGGKPKQGLGLANATGIRIVSNVQVQPGHDYSGFFQFCSRLSDVIIRICENAIEGVFSVILLDEMGMNYNKKRVTSRDNFALEGIFRLIRKFNAVVWILAQNKDLDLPPHLLRKDKGAKTIIEKLRKDLANITVQGVPHLQSQRVREIPPTSLPYDTKAVASLAIDLDPRTLVEDVEWEKQIAEKDKRAWDTNDTYRAIIRWCMKYRQMPGTKGRTAGPPEVIVQRAVALLSTINPDTRVLYSVEEVAVKLQCSEDVVKVALDSLRKAPIDNTQSSQQNTKRVTMLLDKHTDAEIAEILAFPVEFVINVRKARSLGLTAKPGKKQRKVAPATAAVL